jgi:signal peptidase
MARQPRGRGPAGFGWCGQVVAWLVVLGAVSVLGIAVLVPRLAGATPYTVTTGSMRPGLPPGTLVVVRPVAFDEVRVGDVVTYQLTSGRAAVVTHRVVATEVTLAGETRLVTRGDANSVADPEPVRAVQVRGRVWYDVPLLGLVNDLLTGRQRQGVVYLVAGGLAAYAAAMFTRALRGRVRPKLEVAR